MTAIYQIDQPQGRGLTQFLTILIAGGAGVTVALISDFVQKGDASALLVMNTFLNSSLDLSVPILYQAIALLVAGAIAVFVFDPRTKRSAFTMGASILAIFMTIMPVQNYEDLVPIVEEVLPFFELENQFMGDDNGTESEESDADTVPDDAAFLVPQPTPNELAIMHPAKPIHPLNRNFIRAGLFPVILDRTADNDAGTAAFANLLTRVQDERIAVVVSVSVPNGNGLPKLSARLHDATNDRTWDISSIGRAQRTETGYQVYYSTSIVPSRSSNDVLAHLYVRIEAPGYVIAEDDEKVSNTNTRVTLNVDLKPTQTPLLIQRLNKSYKF